MTSTKLQINHNIQKFNNQTRFGHLKIDICYLVVICLLFFGALFQNLIEFIDRHSQYINVKNIGY